MGEHLVTSERESDKVNVQWLHDMYIDYCVEQDIELPAFKENMGKVVHKLFGRQKVKAEQGSKEKGYYYTNMLYVSDEYRETQIGSELALPGHFTFELNEEKVVFHIASPLIINDTCQRFEVQFNRDTSKITINFRDYMIKICPLGISQFADLDQIFINSISKICGGFVLCRGRHINIPPGRKPSSNLYQSVINEVHQKSFEDKKMVWFSKNCVRVLPFTCELSNNTCHCCVHDINQRIRQLKASGRMSAAEAEKVLKKNTKGTEEGEESDDTSMEKSAEDKSMEKCAENLDCSDDESKKQNQAPGEVNFVSMFTLLWDG